MSRTYPAPDTIGERIRLLRRNLGLTQTQLGERPELFVPKNTIAYWENGDRNPKIDQVVGLSKIFNVSCDYLLRGVESDNIESHTQLGLSETAIQWFKDRLINDPMMITLLNRLFETEKEGEKHWAINKLLSAYNDYILSDYVRSIKLSFLRGANLLDPVEPVVDASLDSSEAANMQFALSCFRDVLIMSKKLWGNELKHKVTGRLNYLRKSLKFNLSVDELVQLAFQERVKRINKPTFPDTPEGAILKTLYESRVTDSYTEDDCGDNIINRIEEDHEDV